MKRILPVFSLIAVAIDARNGFWQNMTKTISEDHLLKVFQSDLSLAQAAFDYQSSNDNSYLSIGCSSYKRGQEIALDNRLDDNTNTILLPFHVDSDSDTMCFMQASRAPTSSSKAFDFSVDVLPPLKLHESAYKIVEEEYSFAKPFTAAASYQSFIFENQDQTEFHFRKLVDSLARYSMVGFEKFFWSREETLDFYNQVTDNEFLHDKNRAILWNEFREKFRYLSEEHERSGADPCMFKAFEEEMQVESDTIHLPLSDTLDKTKSDISEICAAMVMATLATDQTVNYVYIASKPELFNYRARSIQQSAKVGSDKNSAPYTAKGLLGTGQIGAVADTGADVQSCYLIDKNGNVPFSEISKPIYDKSRRKVIAYVYRANTGDKLDVKEGHGSHVAGTIAGAIAGANINGAGEYDGVAPNAKLCVIDLATETGGLAIPPDRTLYNIGYNGGARVHTNSWGGYYNGDGFYSGRTVDEYLRSRNDFSIFFAAGNAGSKAKTISVQASAKNVIAVGSSETTYGSTDINYVAFYSSRGPVYDNRIKPDLVAPGASLMSINSNGGNGPSCGTVGMTGTSMASPAAAGAALLIRQYFVDPTKSFWLTVCLSKDTFCKSFQPSGVLVKAVLIHSCSPMTLYHGGGSTDIQLGPPPDYEQGFGRITFAKALPLPGIYNFKLFVEDLVSISEDSEIKYIVDVKNTGFPVTITISWYDPPSVDGSTQKALIHNLDLSAVSPTGKRYYGNGGSSPDVLNTVEKIVETSPVLGRYTVTVATKALPVSGSEKFSIVITGACVATRL